MSVNWDAVHKLLSIAHTAHQWPKLQSLNDAVLRELEVYADMAAKDNAEALRKKAAEQAASILRRSRQLEETTHE